MVRMFTVTEQFRNLGRSGRSSFPGAEKSHRRRRIARATGGAFTRRDSIGGGDGLAIASLDEMQSY